MITCKKFLSSNIMKFGIFLLVIYVIVLGVSLGEKDSNSLRLVHVFFRHGSRTPELWATYPNDPHKADAFAPMGYGQLTMKGKTQALKLGQLLRRRYGKFLGEIFRPEDVLAESTDYDRTKASLMLVLTGLFPPHASQSLKETPNWQPIPYNYLPNDLDYWLRRPSAFCPTFAKIKLDELEKLEKRGYDMENYSTLIYDLLQKTGRNMTSGSILGLFQTLNAEYYMGLDLPEWTKSVFPSPLYEVALKRFEVECTHPVMKRLGGGRMLSKVVKHIIDSKNGTLKPTERKIFLYSGHEFTVINILASMDLFDHQIPKYSSAVTIELHYLQGKDAYAVSVHYLKDISEDKFETLTLEGCERMCPLEKFLEINSPRIPVNYSEECGSSIDLDAFK